MESARAYIRVVHRFLGPSPDFADMLMACCARVANHPQFVCTKVGAATSTEQDEETSRSLACTSKHVKCVYL